ncbi:MAG: L-glyceraldehyde 3-phosphate reductase [Opitutaceae bacterium]|jgi:L-glyceraldehyde 3-phosphate reductase|nr:L-glyceraldehyde 3-phosphate reductase [Opitutaceae bacterium]
MSYVASPSRYANPSFFARCGRSGLLLPRISLGFWHNFGGVDSFENGRAIVRRAFDLGVTHFDLANNYGPPPGSAEENFGKILALDLASYRDEIIITTKAGYGMHPGPYGDWGSRKYLLSSLDASLRRMQLDYVDIFYHHRPDPHTPLEETMGALAHAVRSGKALYVGLSNYDAPGTARAAKILRELGVPALIHQPVYNMFNRWIEPALLDTLEAEGMGCIPFSPLAQGLLTNRYLGGIPADSRAANANSPFLNADRVTPETVAKVQKLGALAQERGQSLAQLALAWVLRDARVTTALIGASKTSQLEDCVGAAANTRFTAEELARIDAILA